MWRGVSFLTAAVALSGALAACSNSFEVGQMDRAAVVSGGGSAGAASDQDQNQAGAEAMEALRTCEPGKPPPALTGPFAEPKVVWSRISQLLWATEREPPAPLPRQTTYSWAADIVASVFDDAAINGLPAPGTELFVPRFLHLPERAAPLSHDWGRTLLSNMPTLELLLLTPLSSDPRRVGIFTEPSWLLQFPQIATRGYIFGNALGLAVPPHRGDISQRENPDPGGQTSRRQAHAAQVSDPTCAACHDHFDPLGYSLEHWGGTGSYQDRDGGRPVDSGGTYELPGSGRELTFDDNVNLSQQLVYVCQANLGMAASYLRMALAHSHVPANERSDAYDANVERFQQAYIGNSRSYHALITGWAQSHIVLDP